jgi:taurine dioxygenase
MSNLIWRPLHATFGALVESDLAAVLEPWFAVAWRALFAERRLLVVRGQAIDAGRQCELMALLGSLLRESESHVTYISNTRADGSLGNTELAFHSDLSFAPLPYDAISLYGEVLTPGISSTVWVDCAAPLERMPTALRSKLAAKQVVNVISNVANERNRLRDGSCDIPHTLHPVVREREDGLAYLFASQGQTDHVVGLDPDASDLLLDETFGYLYAPENRLELVWQLGDLVVWDNRTTQHARADISRVGERTLRRVAIGEATLAQQFPEFMDQLKATYGKGR